MKKAAHAVPRQRRPHDGTAFHLLHRDREQLPGHHRRRTASPSAATAWPCRDHYERWREDFQLVKDLGITFLRYGPPYYRCHAGPEQYDWSWPDETFPVLRKMQIHPIVDLCHFGVPDWVGGFQNPEWPPLFADYARAFAERFPWVRFYTPVNEIFIAASFSAELGWWNERLHDDGASSPRSSTARANVLAEEAILEVQPEALFVQSESSEYFHPALPARRSWPTSTTRSGSSRWTCATGTTSPASMYEYLVDNGMSREEYHWFLDHGGAVRPHCVMGNDYYITNEHEVLDERGQFRPSGEIFGYYVITRQYFDRYHLPVMHTETNRKDADEAPRVAVEGVVQRRPPQAGRRADPRLHLVQPARPDRLGHRPAGGQPPRQPVRPVRPAPQDPPGRRGLPRS